MSACLSCFAKSDGILLHRLFYGSLTADTFPLPLLSSLNSNYDYLTGLHAELISLSSDEFLITWREFHDRLRFILILKRNAKIHRIPADLQRLLAFLGLALTATAGRQTVVDCQDVGLLKKYVMDAAAVFDLIIKSFLDDDVCVLFNYSPLVAHPANTAKLTGILDFFSSSMGVSHSSILVQDRIAAMSSAVDDLTEAELALLWFCVRSANSTETADGRSADARSADARSAASEMLVFLPQLSPDLAYRLFTLKYSAGITVAFLAGRDFELSIGMQVKIDSFWRTEVEALQRLTQLPPKWMAPSLEQELAPELYGLVVRTGRRGRLFLSPCSTASSRERAELRRVQLMAFVRIFSQFNGNREGDSDGTWSDLLRPVHSDGNWSDLVRPVHSDWPRTIGPPVKELYRLSDGYKCYWLHRGDAQIWALFDAATARSRLRVICEATLTLFLPDGKNA
ncbi:hypothetical protein BV898_18210 [Hypsibius exemplaris]|uniref:FUZ/MON1/HPS1 second Longin domain-containing protein n=1 Tax=Hypsibius exemplaris TaxID=2072580 RepID=A0A9X6NIF0_HYPEX|nr:hypothetical protein BV898_18210 [Hypsibius exemplaris]